MTRWIIAASCGLLLVSKVAYADPADAPIEVIVRARSRAESIEREPAAVRVVELEGARQRTADTGEVLARTEGVTVRRAGGLGSSASVGIRGFSDARVRAFADGVPLELSGFTFGLANVPIDLFDRIEIHRGIVPLRLGADALGGAIELVSLPVRSGAHGAASYEVGAFDTHRLTLSVSQRDAEAGYYARARGFADFAQNDYPMVVDAADDEGRVRLTRVYRRHDGYRGLGLITEVGVRDLPWADQLELRTTFADHDKELPHNLLATVPYGEAAFERRAIASQLRHALELSDAVRSEVILGYASARTELHDLGRCRYDWAGECLAILPQRGELLAEAIEQHVQDHGAFGRAQLAWMAHPAHTLRFTVAPSFTTRTGANVAIPEGGFDPLRGRREVARAVVGAEHELKVLGGDLVHLALLKVYGQSTRADELLPNGRVRDLSVAIERASVGSALRYAIADPLYAKAAYEYATRLPEVSELFGDGALVAENLHLEPELSHNLNASLVLERSTNASLSIEASASAFASFARDMIVLLSSDSYARHDNVLDARVLGIEGAIRAGVLDELLSLSVNGTYQDARNTSAGGAFEGFRGDRLPNRLYLFGTLELEAQWRGAFTPDDALIAAVVSRYTHAFYRGWESAGDAGSKLVVPEQLVHDLTLGYRTERAATRFGAFIELHNLGDVRVLDHYGMPRPGRAAYAKVSVAL